MSKQTINIGASPNDGTGTPLRTSFDYTNQNFTELYTALGGGVGLPGATTQVIFNDGGTNLAGDAGLVYNKTTDTLTAGNATITGAATVGTTLGVTGASTLTGNVGVGMSPVVLFNVGGTGGNDGDLYFNTLIRNTGTAATSQPRTGILFSCYSTGTSSFTNFAGITGGKENVTNANTAGFLSLCTSSNGGSPTERARFNSTGAFVLAGGTTTANGIGVAFPTTQSASSDANCLDDYVESTFSPTIVGSTIAGTATYSTQIGRATKVGRLVTFSLRVAYTAGSGTGNLRVGNLPFTAGVGSIFTIYTENIALTAGNIAAASMSAGNTYISIDQLPTGGGGAASVPYDVAGDIQISGSYIV